MMMQLCDKESVISAVCLHYSILGSLGELEQLKRGLQTAGLSALLEQHSSGIVSTSRQKSYSRFYSGFVRSGVLFIGIKL